MRYYIGLWRVKKDIGAWCYGVRVARDINRGWWHPYFEVLCFKLKGIPHEGGCLEPGKHYKGIYWSVKVHFDVIYTVKVFRVGRRYFKLPYMIVPKIWLWQKEK